MNVRKVRRAVSLTVSAVLLAALCCAQTGGALAAAHAARHASAALLKGSAPGELTDPPLGDPTLGRATFMGQITSIDGTDPMNPDGFVVQFGLITVDIKLAQQSVISGRTAEAVVEGLSAGDYALVRARRYKGIWYAARVVFDVQPVPPLRLVSGTIVRITKDARHFSIRPDTGKGAIFVRIVRLTRFHLDGHPLDGPPAQWTFGLTSIAAQTLIRRDNGIWTAYDIYTRSSGFARQS